MNQTRKEHMEWCKARAREYLDRGDAAQAFNSMASDLSTHPQTAGHIGIQLGLMQVMNGGLSTVHAMRTFIEGFN